MNKLLFTAIGVFLTLSAFAQDDVVGVWKTIDDETGKEKSQVKIYVAQNGKIYGKIVAITDPKKQDAKCKLCKGSKKGQPIMGMVIMEGMKKDGSEYSGGTITKPDEGKVYDCKIWREGEDLKVRGYVGWFFRTQTWKRVS